jgi:hypothetical protein
MGDGRARVFKPVGMRFLSFNRGGTRVNKDACACLDCGLVWTFTQAPELQNFIQKYCD